MDNADYQSIGFSDDPLSALTVIDPSTLRTTAILCEPLPARDPNLALAAASGSLFLVGGAAAVNPRQPAFLRISLPPGSGRIGDPPPTATVEALALKTFSC